MRGGGLQSEVKGPRHCGRGRESLCGVDCLGESVDDENDDELQVRGRERGDDELLMHGHALEGTMNAAYDEETARRRRS